MQHANELWWFLFFLFIFFRQNFLYSHRKKGEREKSGIEERGWNWSWNASVCDVFILGLKKIHHQSNMQHHHHGRILKTKKMPKMIYFVFSSLFFFFLLPLSSSLSTRVCFVNCVFLIIIIYYILFLFFYFILFPLYTFFCFNIYLFILYYYYFFIIWPWGF